MKNKTTRTLPTQTPTSYSSIELADQFIAMVKHARAMGLNPVAAITTLEVDGMYCGAVLVLYAAETTAMEGKQQKIPLAPYFYPQGVADSLEGSGILTQVHQSKRSGILTAWCEISDSVR